MADFLQLVSMLREQMHATLSRSDVLKPLAWLIGLLAATMVLLVFGGAPEWLLHWTALGVVLAVLLYGAAYVFCLFKDRDALRSERYSLHKMAIEHGLIGDSAVGMFKPEEVESEPVEATATKQIGHRP